MAANFGNNAPGTIVNGPGVPSGTTVLVFDNLHGTVTLSAPVTSSSKGPVTYSFFGPVVGTGTVLGKNQSPKTIDNLDMTTYNTLLQLGPLSNVQVTGPGIDPGSPVSVQKLSLQNGIPVVTLSSNLDATQISEVGGSFAYTFGYASLSPIVDSGFEQPAVVGYLHGAQLKPGGDQPWTFTDGSTTSQIYAGIAGNGSNYTLKNKPAPQGLQVGFIQGNSSISQSVTFAAGSYQITFLAAQSSANTANQSLQVLIDGNPVGKGAITPSGTGYALQTTASFTVTSGQHTITFQGTSNGSNTALIDAITLKAASALTGVEQQKHPVTVEFLTQPVSTVTGSIVAPVRVAVLDRSGNPLSGLTLRVTLIRIGGTVARPHYVLGKVLHAKTVNGVATFSHLAVHVPGRYVLRALVGQQHAYSEVFEIGTGRA